MNQLIEQARNFFLSMTPGARLTAGLLLAVVVVSVGYLFKQSTSGPDEYLFGAEPLTTAQITAIEAAVGKAGLSGHTVEGNRIRVSRMKKGEYMGAILDAGALPRGAMDYMQEGLDGGGWGDSRAVKQARLKASRERQLSHLIQMMPWVSQASVLYSEEKLPGLQGRSRVAATAAVQPIPGESVDTGRARTIKNLVAGWHPSLSVDGVTVVDQADNSSYSGDMMTAGDFNNPYYQNLVAYENRVRSQIQRRLSYIPGVRVQVSATLDRRIQSQVRSTEVSKKDPLIRNATEVSESTSQNTSDAAVRPGLVAQGPRRVDEQGPQRTNQSEVNNTRTEESAVFPDTRTVEQLAGLVPKEVQATVGVPRDYVVDLWRKEQAAIGEVPDQIDQQQVESIKARIIRQLTDAVEPLLPDPGVQDEFKKVHVDVFDTVDAEPLPAPSLASDALFFASEHSGTMGMVVLGVVGLMMLRSIVNGAPAGDDATGLEPTLQLHAGDDPVNGSSAAVDGDDDGEGGPKLQLKKPESLKDDLASIVREDPEAAAAILRGWIGAAS